MMDVKYTGVISEEQLRELPGMPSPERLSLGPVACLECAQQIPCNPCKDACSKGAITLPDGLTSLPHLDETKCNGCGLCIARCPGLSIFTVHKNFSQDTALVSFPYEYLPVPEVGAEVPCAGRDGLFVTMGKVHRVLCPESFDHTVVVTVEIPKEYCMVVRTIQRGVSRDA